MADQAHKTKTTSWITVLLLVASSIVLGVAMVATSVPLAIVGGVLGVAGLVFGIAFKIMEDVH